ncbi:MAG: hypothetical protein JWO58_9 [Chitinophagaceae bacterium]|nr:hypothetical protein [Chitinophagaceae bacterium]
MKQIPDHFLVELNNLINAKLYNHPVAETSLLGQETLPAIHTAGAMMYIYDYTLQRCFILNGNTQSILGYTHFLDSDIFKLAHTISDSKEVSAFLDDVNNKIRSCYQTYIDQHELKSLKFSFEYKAKRVRGDFGWLAHQMTVLSTDHNGNPVTSMNVITDITEFKRDDKMHFMISMKDKDQLFTTILKLSDKKNSLSERELQILNLLKLGKSSQEISVLLNISEHTVKQHRKNMLQKFNAKNTAELLSKEAA